jgi:hypothetical protein
VWPKPVPTPAGILSDITFENITSVSENGVYVKGRPRAAGETRESIRGVRFVNVRVLLQQRPKNSGSNGPHPSRTDRQELKGEAGGVGEGHPASRGAAAEGPKEATEEAAGGGAEAEKVDAFFIEHAESVSFEGCSAAFEGEPMAGNAYGSCVGLGNGTGGITPPKLDSCVRPEIVQYSMQRPGESP